MTSVRVQGLVSVIIPVYNVRPFLAEAVESVRAQNYSLWELLLIDDGSTDGSDATARRYAETDPARIRYLEHPQHKNLGVCSTRNLGVRHSRGEFLALLDSDDLWLPGKLGEQVGLMREHPEAAMVFGNSIYFYEGRGPEAEYIPTLAPSGTLYQPPRLLKISNPLGKATAPCPSEFLMRYELWEKVGGFEESFNRTSMFEDLAFLVKVYLDAPVYISATCGSRYRCHASSSTGRAESSGQIHEWREFFLDWLEQYLRDQNVEDKEIWRAMERLTLPRRYPRLAHVARLVRGAARRVLPGKA